MNKAGANNRLSYIILTIIIVAGICRFSYGFFVQKQAFHSDEVWSYGLANSYYEPHVVFSDDASEYKNLNEWITNDTFTKYYTVQEGERFAIGSVFYNMSCDTHPPLYFILLNFLCSFFPNQFIPALGFIINMVAYIFMAIFAYKLLLIMTSSKKISLLGTAFSTFSVATLCMTIFIRPYMSVATIGLIYVYITAKLFFLKDYRRKKSTYISLGIISLAGALTDNFFLPFAFGVTVVMCLAWLIKRDFKTTLKYAGSMATSIGLSIIIFPRTVMSAIGMLGVNINVVSSVESTASSAKYMPTFFQLKLLVFYVSKELFGLPLITPYYTGTYAYVLCGIAIILFLLTGIAFLCRKSLWFHRVCSRLILLPHKSINFIVHKCNYITLSMVVGSAIVFLSTSYIVDVYGFGLFADRYVMVCYPELLILLLLFVWRIVATLTRQKRMMANLFCLIIITVLTVFSNAMTQCHYLFYNYDSTVKLSDISDGSNLIILSSWPWLLQLYGAELLNSNDVFLTSLAGFDDNINKISNKKLAGDSYIVIETDGLSDADFEYGSASTSDLSPNNEITTTIGIFGATLVSNTSETKAASNYDYTLKNLIEKCYDISYVEKLTYIGHDYANGRSINIYKIN